MIEFRHERWFTDEVYDLLKAQDVACAMISAPDYPEEAMQTADTAYLRFHGKDPNQWYKYDYSKEELKSWAEKVKKLDAKELFIYFNNDYEANSISNCQTFKELLEHDQVEASI